MASSQKTDKVSLKNGDVLTGEITGLSLAILTYKMDGPGTIEIKWEEVTALKSDKIFEISLRNGLVVVGRVDSVFLATYHVTLDDIVDLAPIKSKFIRRLSGDIAIGFNFNKSSNALQFNLGSTVVYRIPKMELGIKLTSVLSNNKNDSSLSKKQDLILNMLNYFNNHYFIISQLGWQQNTELGLSNRFLLNGAAGKDLLVNNHNRLMAAGGLSLNMEESIESQAYVGKIDGLALLQYRRFYYSTPELLLNTSLVVYPGLTEWGRVRLEFNFSGSVEIVKDFSIGLTFYDNYDNRPPKGRYPRTTMRSALR